MRIIILGAGAIGSLFGAFLAIKNDVTLVGRSSHIDFINKKGLTIDGKTKINININAKLNIENIKKNPDLIILTVKSYDTIKALENLRNIIGNNTRIISFQNGLDNFDKISKIVDNKKIIMGITTHGAIFSKPGLIEHTGIGKTYLGELDGKETERIKFIIEIFNDAGIKTYFCNNIIKEIWIKGIINSCINPLTLIFQCNNGYLLKNPILKNILGKICTESTNIANIKYNDLTSSYIFKRLNEVIVDTSDNYSSMLQSYLKGRRTEIDSINGKIMKFGLKNKVDVELNTLLINIVNKFSDIKE
jgi:2-dehydropantoate 2-reductase